MLLALSLVNALAADWSGPRVIRDDDPRKISVAAGLGGAWIAGSSAAGFSGGLVERLVLDVPTGDLCAFTLDLDHSRHALVDADAYFPAVRIPGGSISGFRDYFAIDVGFRLGFPVPRDPARVSTVPFTRIGVGAVFTSTLLEAPGIDGRVALRSNTAWFAPSLALGAEVRIKRWISVLPQVRAQVQVVEDAPESTDAPSPIVAEWRYQPTVDVRINF